MKWGFSLNGELVGLASAQLSRSETTRNLLSVHLDPQAAQMAPQVIAYLLAQVFADVPANKPLRVTVPDWQGHVLAAIKEAEAVTDYH